MKDRETKALQKLFLSGCMGISDHHNRITEGLQLKHLRDGFVFIVGNRKYSRRGIRLKVSSLVRVKGTSQSLDRTPHSSVADANCEMDREGDHTL